MPTISQTRGWERRAATLKRKAEELMFDIVETEDVPVREVLSDFADNVVHQAEDLIGAIQGDIRRASFKGQSHDR